MLTSVAAVARVASLERLESGAGRPHADDIDWQTPIDRSRRFFCETLTPLYYTPSYAQLGPAHRRRYSQLVGMLANELIAQLESDIVDVCLGAVAQSTDIGTDLIEAVRRFRDDERRHADTWQRLNRLSEPEWYREEGRPRLVRVPAVIGRLAQLAARHPTVCPAVLWIQLVQEERSIEISRRCVRMPAHTIEPRYAAVYREHLRDEVRHVQVDCHLLEHFYATQSPRARRMTAAVLRWVVRHFFLRPSRSSVRVVEVLASEYRELQPLLPSMIRELRGLVNDDRYHDMMYSRRTTPITFALFDACPEFHSMSRVLRAYTPRPPVRTP